MPELPGSRRTCSSIEERHRCAEHPSVLAVLVVGLLALPAVAGAAPTVKFKAEAVPIPGFKGTGNILGAGAAVHANTTIEGTEYGGFPPPIIGVNFYLPLGTKLHTSGFPTCAKNILEQTGPSGCPKSSEAGPIGNVLGIVSFGSERVEESADAAVLLLARRRLRVLHRRPLAGVAGNPVGRELREPRRSRRLRPRAHHPGPARLDGPGCALRVGQVDQREGRLGLQEGQDRTYYGRVPTKCPKGGFPIKTEVIFDEGGAVPPVPEPVTATYKAPCPKSTAKK